MALIILFRKQTKTELRYKTRTEETPTQSSLVFSLQSKATRGGHGDRGIHLDKPVALNFRDMLV